MVQFHLRDAATSAQDLERTLAQLPAPRIPSRRGGALLFSCSGRGTGPVRPGRPRQQRVPPPGREKCPIGGFFCSGEIGPVQTDTCLHGYTSAFAVFRGEEIDVRA